MASFKTAYLQKEDYKDVDVVGSSALKVGDCVQLVAATGSNAAYIQKSTFANATHIIAQSDQTIGYGHVPVENRDYRYDPSVATTNISAPTTSNAKPKHVALFYIYDKNDIILAADGSDVSA